MLKKLLFLLLFGLFACSKSDVDLKIVNVHSAMSLLENYQGLQKVATIVNFSTSVAKSESTFSN